MKYLCDCGEFHGYGQTCQRLTRRAERLSTIIEHLLKGRVVRAYKLASAMQVAERTIVRDINILRRSGMRIDGEPGVGYMMRAIPAHHTD